METHARHVLIGVFTIAIAAAAMLFGLWLTSGRNNKDVVEFEVIFREAVAGLSQGSSVEFSGIKVGEVARLTLDRTDPRIVRARIRVGSDTPIRRDTRARLTLPSLTGASVIQLSGGSPESPPLQTQNGDIPIIVASPSPRSQIAASGEELMVQLTAVLRDARAILSEKNATRLSHILDNLDHTTGIVAEERKEIVAIISSLAKASRQMEHTVQQASAVFEKTNSMLAGEGKRIGANTEQLTASLARTANTLDKVLAANSPALDQGLAGAAEIGPAIRELRATLSQLQLVTRRLQDNPSAYLLGREHSREFSP